MTTQLKDRTPSIPGLPVGRVQSERSGDGRNAVKSKGMKKQILAINNSKTADESISFSSLPYTPSIPVGPTAQTKELEKAISFQ